MRIYGLGLEELEGFKCSCASRVLRAVMLSGSS